MKTEELLGNGEVHLPGPPGGIVAELLDSSHLDHFWYRGRNAILKRFFLRHYGGGNRFRYLDYGAGSGSFAVWTQRAWPEAEVFAADSSRELLQHIERQGITTVPVPLPREIHRFDVVTLWDVLEHIPDDRSFLDSLRSRMVPHGRLLLSVPAHPWLFGPHDRRVGHQRRYTQSGLLQLLSESGYQCLHVSWYMTHLFPLMLGVRLLERGQASPSALRTPPKFINGILSAVFGWERWLVPITGYPFGASLILVAEKVFD